MADDDDIDDEDIASKFEGVRTRTRDLTAGSNAFARAITAAFAQGATGAKSFDSVLKSLALRLSNLSVSMALKPAIGSLFGGSKSVLGGLFSSSSVGISGATGAEDAASIQPFAKGGVIATPTYFPLGARRRRPRRRSRTRGDHAADARARRPARRRRRAGSGAPNVTVNIATPDADSFRRSERYLTGLIARAVARGQRGM